MNTDGLGYQTRQETSTGVNPYDTTSTGVNPYDETSKPTEGACREVAREIKSGYEMGELVLLLERQK